MRRIYRLICLTFVENFAIILIERGIYFYTDNRLGFGKTANLALAVVFGVAYILGALISHRLSVRLGEKRLLQVTIVAQLAGYVALVAWPIGASIFAVNALLGVCNGLKWPVVESYINAGLTPTQTARAVGWFNVTWAGAMLLSVATAGVLIDWDRRALFEAAGLMSLVSWLIVWPMALRPTHLAHDHPDRPAAGQIVRIRHLLRSSRLSMFASYAALFLLAPLIPAIFRERLGFAAPAASALSGVLDAMRLGVFVLLNVYSGWHNRGWPLAVSLVALPLGLAAVLGSGSLGLVLAGEAAFGLASGVVYYAALYYAMVAENASVDAGGGHEAMIGLGFAVGPAAGLLGAAMAGRLGGDLSGVMVGIGPVMVVCAAMAAMALVRARRAGASK